MTPRIITGLNNVGNTCFMNSALQLFMSCDHLINFFKQYSTFKTPILAEIRKFIDLYEQGGAISPRGVKDAMGIKDKRFTFFRQEDSHEFIFEMLDFIEESLKKEFETDQQESMQEKIVSELFDVETKTYLKSLDSDDKSVVKHPLRFLHVSLPKTSDVVSLNKCLSNFFDKEILDGDNMWQPEGKEMQKAIKATYITKFPKYLIFMFKRYEFEKKGRRGWKLDTEIEALSKWESEIFPENSYYELNGCVVQSGSLSGGHYYACVLSNGVWYRCNDSHVGKISEKEALREASMAYLLLYTQKKCDERLDIDSKPNLHVQHDIQQERIRETNKNTEHEQEQNVVRYKLVETKVEDATKLLSKHDDPPSDHQLKKQQKLDEKYKKRRAKLEKRSQTRRLFILKN